MKKLFSIFCIVFLSAVTLLAQKTVITYKLSTTTKLAETTSKWDPGIHKNAFLDASDNVLTYTHTWNSSTKTGTLTFNGVVTTIGENAFYKCDKMTSVTIPATTTKIGVYAFSNCSTLVAPTIPEGVTIIEDYAFSLTRKFTAVTIPSTVMSIGSSAFSSSSLTSITLKEGLTSIGNLVFDGCTGLTSVTIPASVTSIGMNPFTNTSKLTTIKVADGNSVYDSRNNCNAIVETASNTIISGCKTTTFISTITGIGVSAFQQCPLTTITIPNNITSIGKAAFRMCKSLTSVTLPTNITQIADWTFDGCAALTSITIPANVTSIGSIAFRSCTKLNTVAFAASSTLKTINEDAFYQCSALSNITLPSGLQTIARNVFRDCIVLTAMSIPNTVKSIGASCFQGCTKLKTCTFPTSSLLTSISGGMFSDCTTLEAIEIPASITSIGSSTFSNCTSLKSVTFLGVSKLKEISSSCFSGCSSLTTFTIPSTVTKIGNTAFQNCTSLTKVEMKSFSAPAIPATSSNMFKNDAALKLVLVPDGRVSAYKTSANWTQYEALLADRRLLDTGDSEATEMAALMADGGEYDLTLYSRTLAGGMWNTLCLPFDISAEDIALSPLAGAQIAEFVYAYGDIDNGIDMKFAYTDHIEAGVPYIVVPTANITNPKFLAAQITSGSATFVVGDNGVKFCGSYSQHHLPGGDKSYVFIGSGNTLTYPEAGDTSDMKGFRAWFELPGTPSAVAKRNSRISFYEDAATALESVQQQSSLNGEGAGGSKSIVNGQLVITRGDRQYNAQGLLLK